MIEAGRLIFSAIENDSKSLVPLKMTPKEELNNCVIERDDRINFRRK